mmetsp:Transcript_67735/g.218859  ORF Transcript_67735/g.218859 Transcript_67735/m.218859 type:complete len:282 (-) Transcript_67735:73-918(-)
MSSLCCCCGKKEEEAQPAGGAASGGGCLCFGGGSSGKGKEKEPPAGLPPYDKAAAVEFGCNCGDEKDRGSTEEVGRLQRDLAGTYYWSGGVCTDFWFFVANWHPLVGIFLSHPAHPWSKTERIASTIFSVGFSLLPSALLVAVSSQSDRDDVKLLGGAMVFVCVTLPVMIWEIALYWIAIADMFCKGRCDCILPCITAFQKCCLCGSVAIALFFAILAMIIVHFAGADIYKVFYPVISSRVQSWLVWFPIWILLPYLGFAHCWYLERKEFRKISPSHVQVV